jgi:predicted alpha/beta superfamily hydrolase
MASTTVGNIGIAEGHIEYHRQVKSRLLLHPRDIVVWLPPSYYKRRSKRFPVMYMHDGQNLMDPATSFLGVDWQVDESATRLIQNEAIRELMIVGIYNTPDREKEYTGSKSGRNYAAFVVNELKPLIDSVYRTQKDSRHTAVGGSSLGGLISFYMAWWYPNIFSKAACMSSSFFWENYRVLKDVAIGPKKKIQFYIDVGSREVYLREGYEKMIQALRKKGYRKGVDLEYRLEKDATHDEYSWGKRFWRPLRFLFGKED